MSPAPFTEPETFRVFQQRDDDAVAALLRDATDDELAAEIDALYDAAHDCERPDERRRVLLAFYATRRALRRRESARATA